MKVLYSAVYRVRGACALPEGAETVPLVKLIQPALTATLTTNPERQFEHIDRATAIIRHVAKSLAVPHRRGTVEDSVEVEMEMVRQSRTRNATPAVFVAMEGESDIDVQQLEHRISTPRYDICLDDIGTEAIHACFEASVRNVLMGLALSLPSGSSPDFDDAGTALRLLDSDNGAPVYPLTIRGSTGDITTATPLTGAVIVEATALVSRLSSEEELAKPVRLLNASLDTKTDGGQAFLAAWTALEIFVNATFQSTYEDRLFETIANGVHASPRRVLDRLREIARGKYSLVDKFRAITSVLDPGAADDDCEEFKRVKDIRDDLIHAVAALPPLPTRPAQSLLLRYLKLHLGVANERRS